MIYITGVDRKTLGSRILTVAMLALILASLNSANEKSSTGHPIKGNRAINPVYVLI